MAGVEQDIHINRRKVNEVIPALSEHTKLNTNIPLDYLQCIQNGKTPFLYTEEELSAAEMEAQYMREEEYIESCINKYLDSYPGKYANINTAIAKTSEVVPDLQSILAFAANLMWETSGQHSDESSEFNRGPIEDAIGVFPNRGTWINCRSFNGLFIRIYEHIARKIDPEILTKHALKLESLTDSPNVTRQYFSPSANVNGWTHSHSNIVLFSATSAGDLVASVIDPYHIRVRDGSLSNDSIDCIDFSETRPIEAIIALAKATSGNDMTGSNNPQQQNNEQVIELTSELDLEDNTRQTQILRWSTIKILTQYINDFENRSKVNNLPLENALNFFPDYASRVFDATNALLKTKPGDKLDIPETKQLLHRFNRRIFSAETFALSPHNTIVTNLQRTNFISNFYKLLFEFTDRAIDDFHDSQSDNLVLDANLVLAAFHGCVFLCMNKLINPDQVSRIAKVIENINNSNHPKLTNIKSMAYYTVRDDTFVVSQRQKEDMDGNIEDDEEYKAWLSLHMAFAKLASFDDSRSPKVKVEKSSETFDKYERALIEAYGVVNNPDNI